MYLLFWCWRIPSIEVLPNFCLKLSSKRRSWKFDPIYQEKKPSSCLIFVPDRTTVRSFLFSAILSLQRALQHSNVQLLHFSYQNFILRSFQDQTIIFLSSDIYAMEQVHLEELFGERFSRHETKDMIFVKSYTLYFMRKRNYTKNYCK